MDGLLAETPTTPSTPVLPQPEKRIEHKHTNGPVDAIKNTMSLEKVLALEDEITILLQRKREVERNLAALEVQLYNSEGRYLEQTLSLGNVAKGFDGYMQLAIGQRQTANSSALNVFGAGSTAVQERDRLFSQSSSTYLKALQVVKEIELGGPMSDYGYKSSTTPLTPMSGGGGMKKKRSGGRSSSSLMKKTKKRSTAASMLSMMDDSETGASSSSTE